MTQRQPAPTTRSSYSDNAEFWVRIMRERLDRYRNELTNDVVLAAVGPHPGLDVLDAGCGEGYLSRLLARAGASVTGIDACDELISAAHKAADEEGLDIAHLAASVDDLPLDPDSVDVVVFNHLLNDLADLRGPMAEAARVLRSDGRLIALLLHPCFYQPHADRSSANGSPGVEAYFAGRVIEQPFSVAGITSPAPVMVHVRPLEAVTGALTDSGFAITSLTEPHPSAEQIAASSWWAANYTRPMFMLITARLLHSGMPAPIA